MRLRRMMITNGLVADLRRAIRLLAEFARGSFPEGNPLSLAILDDPKLMAQSLRQRDQNLYTFEVIGELTDCSKATISRIMAEPEACKRKNTSGGNPNARRKTLHKSNPSKASQ